MTDRPDLVTAAEVLRAHPAVIDRLGARLAAAVADMLDAAATGAHGAAERPAGPGAAHESDEGSTTAHEPAQRLDEMTDDQLDALRERLDQAEREVEVLRHVARGNKQHVRYAVRAHDEQRARAERAERAVRRVRQMAAAWRLQLPETIRTDTAVDALLTATEHVDTTSVSDHPDGGQECPDTRPAGKETSEVQSGAQTGADDGATRTHVGLDWHVETEQPDGTWEGSSSHQPTLPDGRQRLTALQRRRPDDQHRLVRRTVTTVNQPETDGEPEAPGVPLRDRLAEAMYAHHYGGRPTGPTWRGVRGDYLATVDAMLAAVRADDDLDQQRGRLAATEHAEQPAAARCRTDPAACHCLTAWRSADRQLDRALDAEREVGRLTDQLAAVARVRQLHAPVDPAHGPWCQVCTEDRGRRRAPWPCPTVTTLDGALVEHGQPTGCTDAPEEAP